MANYVNGNAVKPGEFTSAREILISMGIYQKLDNFGEYNKSKQDCEKYMNIVRKFKKSGFEFRIMEGNAISLGFSLKEAKNVECWFQSI